MAPSSAAMQLFRRGVRICRHGGSLVTAERALKAAIRKEPTLAAEAYLALAQGADARLFDRSVVTAYRKLAVEHARARRASDDAGARAAELVDRARAHRTADTLAADRKALRCLERAARIDDTPAIQRARADVLETIAARSFGAGGIGHLAILAAVQRRRLDELVDLWTQIADSYTRAGNAKKASPWRRWLARVEDGDSWALRSSDAPRRSKAGRPAARARRAAR